MILSFAIPWAVVVLRMSGGVSRDSVPATLPSALATISTDTGAFAPGHQDFARYTTPLECAAAATLASRVARSKVSVITTLDTLQDATGDTIGLDRVRRVAQACGRRFTLENTPPMYFSALLTLAVAAQNETAAQGIFTRMTSALSPTARVHMAATILDDLLGGDTTGGGGFVPAVAVPPRPHALYTPERPLATFLMGVIDQQGALPARVLLQERLRQYWIMRRDSARARRQAEQVLALARQLPPGTHVNPNSASSQDHPVWAVYHDLLRHAFYYTSDSLHAITQRAQQDLGAFQTYQWAGKPLPVKSAVIDFHALSVEATIDTLLPERARWRDTARKPLPALRADFWFAPTHAPVTNPVQPVPGQVTFIMVGDASATGSGPRQASLVRRMLAEYGTRGLAVTVMGRTEGWIDDGDYMRALDPLMPAAEAEQIRALYQDHEGLPVTVGVQVHHFTKRPPPDGRLVKTDIVHPFPPYCDNDEAAWVTGPRCAVLVGRDGTVLWQGDMLATDNERDGALLGTKSEFRDILAKAITETSTTRWTPSSPSSPAQHP